MPSSDAWSLHRFDPGPRPAPYAVWHWIVVWDLPDQEPHHQATLRAVSLLEQPSRVSELAERLSVSVRTVRRLFADHVGLSPCG